MYTTYINIYRFDSPVRRVLSTKLVQRSCRRLF